MNSCIYGLSENARAAETPFRLFCGVVGILLLVYIMAELTPKLAAFIDRLAGGKTEAEPPPDPEKYSVHDPYEGEMKEPGDNGRDNGTSP